MRDSTEYQYRFENTGTPADLEVGKTTRKTMIMALYVWLGKVSMNKNIKITLERDPMDGMNQDDASDLEAMFAQLNEES